MVSYMWGRDVADALLATEAVSEDCEVVTAGLGRICPLRMPIEFKPIDNQQTTR